jgi:D-alanine-D-alanine ligase
MINVLILFGGKSTEHEGSVLSYKNIIKHLSADEYNISSVAIDRDGKWWLGHPSELVDDNDEPELSKNFYSNPAIRQVFMAATPTPSLYNQATGELVASTEMVFPMLHGTNGEDGSIQGFLQIMGVDYVGCGVLSSALCINKVTTKLIASSKSIPTAEYVQIRRNDGGNPDFSSICRDLGLPFFIKPVSLGSSVAARKISSEHEFEESLDAIFKVDSAALAEKLISGVEISCLTTSDSGLNNLGVAELRTNKDHLTNYDKLHSTGAISLIIPAEIDPGTVEVIKDYSIRLYKACSCRGTIRTDFFVTEDGKILFSEINSMPGLSKISIVPKILASGGYPMQRFLDYLLTDARLRN